MADLSAWEALDKFAVKFSRPDFDAPNIPADITLLSSEQLAETFSMITAWADFAASELATAHLAERAAQQKMELQENRLLVERMGSAVKGERITLVKAQISLDPEVRQLSTKYEEAYAYRKLVDMLLSNYERDLALVSREITRRANDQRANRKDYGF